jgi:hypothetical protein
MAKGREDAFLVWKSQGYALPEESSGKEAETGTLVKHR